MATTLDDAAAIPPVECPVEPDESSCMTQAAVDPRRVFGTAPGTEVATGDYAVVSNTLVFTSPTARRFTRLETPGTTPLNDFFRLLPVVGTYKENMELSVVGVAYDGVESAEAAKHHPDAKGRVVVQVTGTVTCTIHPLDLEKLEVGDLLSLDGRAYSGGLVGMPHVKLPHIVPFKTDARATLLRLLIERARNFAGNNGLCGTPPFQLAVALCSFYRDKFPTEWTDAETLCKEREGNTAKEISKALEKKEATFTLLEKVVAAVNSAAKSGFTLSLDVPRVVASVCASVDDLNYLYELVNDNLDALGDPGKFAELLESKVATQQPFGLMLEPGYNQARILLKPGVRL